MGLADDFKAAANNPQAQTVATNKLSPLASQFASSSASSGYLPQEPQLGEGPAQLKKIADLAKSATPGDALQSALLATPETVLNIATGLGASVIGGYHGAAKLLTGGSLQDAANAVAQDQQDYTYQPRSVGGKIVGELVAAPMNAVKQMTSTVGSDVGHGIDVATGQPSLAGGSGKYQVMGQSIGNIAPDIAMAAAPIKGILAPTGFKFPAAPRIEPTMTPIPRDLSLLDDSHIQSTPQPTAPPIQAPSNFSLVPQEMVGRNSPPSLAIVPESQSGSSLSLVPKDLPATNLSLAPLSDAPLSLERMDKAKIGDALNPAIDPSIGDIIKQRIKAAQDAANPVDMRGAGLSLEPKFTLTSPDAEIALAQNSSKPTFRAPVDFSFTPADAAHSVPTPDPAAIRAPVDFSLEPREAIKPPQNEPPISNANNSAPEPQESTSAIAAQRHAEAKSLPVPIDLTEGQATGNIHKLSFEQNNRGNIAALGDRFAQQNEALGKNFDAIREGATPDISAAPGVATDQALVDSIKGVDAPIRAEISARYKALKDANGGEFPLSGQDFVSAADRALKADNVTRFVPSEVSGLLADLREGGPMNYGDFENYRTILGQQARKYDRAGDGTAEHAVNIVRSALEALPMSEEAAAIKPLADAARQAAAERFAKIASDPAYKAAINDGVPIGEPSPVADGFIKKYVINGKTANVKNLTDNLKSDAAARQIIAAGVIDNLKQASGIDLRTNTGNISQAGLNKAINSLGDKKSLILDPETAQHIDTLGNVARYTQQQPRGSYVNNSNTFVAGVASKAKKGVEMAVNAAVPGLGLGTAAREALDHRAQSVAVKKILSENAGVTPDLVATKEASIKRIQGAPKEPAMQKAIDGYKNASGIIRGSMKKSLPYVPYAGMASEKRE